MNQGFFCLKIFVKIQHMLKFLLAGAIFATCISWVSFAAILFNLNPENSGILGITLFYASLFLGLLGIIFIGMIYFKRKIFRMEISSIIHGVFRQSAFMSSFFVGLLFLSQSHRLNIISAIVLTVFILALETYFRKMSR